MNDLLALDSFRPLSNKATSLPVTMQQITTPLRWEAWDHSLAPHPDPRFRRYLVDGIREGFRIGFDYSRECHRTARNMASSILQPAVVQEYLAIECAAGRVLGPFSPEFLPNVQVRSYPKESLGKMEADRRPFRHSVNDGRFCSMQYVSVENAVQLLVKKALMAKIDIKSAYRIVPIHPDDRWLLGMTWEGRVFVDATLPFGLRSAPNGNSRRGRVGGTS